MRKETLEEAAKKYAEEYKGEEQDPWFDFMEGAKWQQQRSYSEEEVKNILFEWSVYKVNTAFSDGEIMDYEQWFEQFKKK